MSWDKPYSLLDNYLPQRKSTLKTSICDCGANRQMFTQSYVKQPIAFVAETNSIEMSGR